MAHAVDMVGRKFGRLTPLRRAEQHESPSRKSYYCAFWLCRCECGQPTVVPGGALRKGMVKSCGCLRREERQCRQRERNPNVRMAEEAAKYAFIHKSRMTPGAIASHVREPANRVSAVARAATWVGIDAAPLPALAFPAEIEGDAVRPVPGYEETHAVTRGGLVYTFPKTADGKHRAYAEPHRLIPRRCDGAVKMCRPGDRRRVRPDRIAAEAWEGR